jgi:exosome complex RNA-binding protein Rrp4
MDKSFNLHTRNPKYGKLEPGIFVSVPHKLIKKQKHHFITLSAPESDAPVGIILGNNGNIWLSALNRNVKDTDKEASEKNNSIKNGDQLSLESMKNISLLYNIIKILSWEGLEISEPLLLDILSFIH